MQAQTRTRNQARADTPRLARVVSSYTCPRCRGYGKTTPCSRCGWTPEAQSAQPLTDHEDRIIAC